MRTTGLPLRNIQFKPAFWGVDRNLREVMDTIENVWEGSSTEFNSLQDFKETEQAFLMTMDIPGVNKENLEVKVDGDFIHIEAKRKVPFGKEDDFHTMNKTISLPKGIEREKVQAHTEDGVLYLAIPKAEVAKPKNIKISEGSTEDFNRLLSQ